MLVRTVLVVLMVQLDFTVHSIDSKWLPQRSLNQVGTGVTLSRSRRQDNTKSWARILQAHEKRLQLTSPPNKEEIEPTAISIVEVSPVPTAGPSDTPNQQESHIPTNGTIPNDFLPWRLTDRTQRPQVVVQPNNTQVPEGRESLDKMLLAELGKLLNECSQQKQIPKLFLEELEKLMQRYSGMFSGTEECEVSHRLMLVQGARRNGSIIRDT